MPTLSMFYGIIVSMHCEGGASRHIPHIHVRYGECEASYALDGRRLVGHLPKGKEGILLAWMEIHRDELKANWELSSSGQPPFKIEPLR